MEGDNIYERRRRGGEIGFMYLDVVAAIYVV